MNISNILNTLRYLIRTNISYVIGIAVLCFVASWVNESAFAFVPRNNRLIDVCGIVMSNLDPLFILLAVALMIGVKPKTMDMMLPVSRLEFGLTSWLFHIATPLIVSSICIWIGKIAADCGLEIFDVSTRCTGRACNITPSTTFGLYSAASITLGAIAYLLFAKLLVLKNKMWLFLAINSLFIFMPAIMRLVVGNRPVGSPEDYRNVALICTAIACIAMHILTFRALCKHEFTDKNKKGYGSL